MPEDDSHRSELNLSYRYTDWMHGAGVVLSVTALALGGLSNPDIGFPIAIAIVTALGLLSSPDATRPAILRVIHGSVTTGGLKQGAFIKAMFAVALVYGGLYPILFESGGANLSNLILGTALSLSSVATELEARALRSTIQSSNE